MSYSYAFHFLSFRAQNYALNLFFKDFLLQRSLEVTKRVLLNTIQEAAQGTSKFRVEDEKVFYEKKVFVHDFQQFYLSFYNLLELVKQEGHSLENFIHMWTEWIHMRKQDFSLEESSQKDEKIYLQAKILLDNCDYEQLCFFLSSQKTSSLKDYFLRNCAIYFLKKGQQEKAKAILQHINSSFNRAFVLGELVRKALVDNNSVEAQALLPLIPNLHLKACLLQIVQSGFSEKT